jgi:hypothetical protein
MTMKKQKWNVRADDPRIVEDSAGRVVAHVVEAADAKKIAATPLLIAALTALVRRWDSNVIDMSGAADRPYFERARTAIKKAGV